MPRMRRQTELWIAVGVVAVLGVAGVGAWQYVAHLRSALSPTTQAHQTAVADSSKTVDRVVDQFGYDHLYQAADYVHTAGQTPGVQVLSVAGQTHWQSGVTLVLKVTAEHDEPICDRRYDDIACPAGAPLPVAKDPTLDGVDSRLESVLKPVGPHEAAARAAVARLKLDPAIKQDYAAQGGVAGVALRASQYDCVVARVTAKGVQLWRPSHTQLAPGELGCDAGLALSSEFNTSPH
jgi:hypothetical protein